MSNLKEGEYEFLRDKELEETIQFFDFQQEWENNPARILLEKQIEQIGKEIDELADWFGRNRYGK